MSKVRSIYDFTRNALTLATLKNIYYYHSKEFYDFIFIIKSQFTPNYSNYDIIISCTNPGDAVEK